MAELLDHYQSPSHGHFHEAKIPNSFMAGGDCGTRSGETARRKRQEDFKLASSAGARIPGRKAICLQDGTNRFRRIN